MGLFSPEHPCRCGYQGEGFHRCHVGRPDPNGTGEDGSRWCPHPAVDHLHATLGSLAGMQLKFSLATVSFCEFHRAEFLGGKEYPTEVSDEGSHSR